MSRRLHNFRDDRLLDLTLQNEVIPAVNQVETHPFCQQIESAKLMKEYNVQIESWAPFAEGKSATPAQISLAWVLAQKPWIVPVPGTRKLERLEENLDAVDVKLTQEELNHLNDPLLNIEVSGDRYSAEYANRVGK